MKPSITLALAALTLTGSAFGQTTKPKPNLIQKHPTLTGVAAGVATHAALKKSAAAKKKTHQKLNFAEKHPTLTGIAAGATTRTVIKKSTHK